MLRSNKNDSVIRKEIYENEVPKYESTKGTTAHERNKGNITWA